MRDDDPDEPPPTLVDGSPGLPAPLGLPPGVRGVVHVRRAEDVDQRRLRTCMALVGAHSVPPDALVVERIGVDGRSLTFRDPRAPRLYGCDASTQARERRVGSWCGGAVGTLPGGSLTDARLDLANCRDRRGRTVAFAWLDAPLRAEWLAVDRGGSVEYHRVAGNVPVRVASTSAVSGPASAEYHVRAYGPGPDEQERTVRVSVAG